RISFLSLIISMNLIVNSSSSSRFKFSKSYSSSVISDSEFLANLSNSNKISHCTSIPFNISNCVFLSEIFKSFIFFIQAFFFFFNCLSIIFFLQRYVLSFLLLSVLSDKKIFRISFRGVAGCIFCLYISTALSKYEQYLNSDHLFILLLYWMNLNPSDKYSI